MERKCIGLQRILWNSVFRLRVRHSICEDEHQGFLLVEALLGSLLLVVIISGFFLVTSHSIKWLHMLHHRHELLLDSRFSRIQIMNLARYSDSKPRLATDGTWLLSRSNGRVRVYQDTFVTILSDGQLQAITESEISPKIGKIFVHPQGSGFFHERHNGLIDLSWYSEVRPYWRRTHIQLMEGGTNRYSVHTGILPYATYFNGLSHTSAP